LITIVVISAAQATDQPLTNSDIQSMLAAGLPESTILLRIETAASRGLVDLDASVGALTALKQSGGGERVLNDVIWAEPFGAARKQKQDEDRAVPGLPPRAGVYYKDPSGWVMPPSFLLWTPFVTGWDWFSRGHVSSVDLGSGTSPLQVPQAQPEFYLREPVTDRGWRIIRLGSGKDQRLLQLTSAGGIAEVDRIRGKQVRTVQMTHVAGGIYVVKPAADLEAGEYVLCSEVPGGPDLNACYSFGVRRSRAAGILDNRLESDY
jgi:hypothetical protein